MKVDYYFIIIFIDNSLKRQRPTRPRSKNVR